MNIFFILSTFFVSNRISPQEVVELQDTKTQQVTPGISRIVAGATVQGDTFSIQVIKLCCETVVKICFETIAFRSGNSEVFSGEGI